MLFLGALVVDVGNWFVHRRHLQTQVDAAALAAATSFNGCFLNQPAANTKVADIALLYAGDTNRQPSGAPSPPLNAQVTPDQSVHVVLNSDDYWPTATVDGWTAANPGGWATSDDQKPCTVKYIDVKATDDDVPGLLRLIPFRPDIHANAQGRDPQGRRLHRASPVGRAVGRPELRRGDLLQRGDRRCRRRELLTKGAFKNLNGASLRSWAADVERQRRPERRAS